MFWSSVVLTGNSTEWENVGHVDLVLEQCRFNW